MRVEATGHAGLRLAVGDDVVLLDPWFDPAGAFQASWFPFPRNDHLVDDSIFRPSAIVVSHEHLDHLDPWFLSQVPPSVSVVVPAYASDSTKAKVLAAGTRPVVELEPWRPHCLTPDLSVFFVSEESPMNHDSAMVLTSGDSVLVNLNDARLSTAQLRRIRAQVGDVDVLAVQGAGASWFPVCYDYPEARQRELASAKRSAKFRYVEHVIRVIEPTVTLPMAGPPCFLDDELRHLNRHLGPDGIFPTQDQVRRHLIGRGLDNIEVLLPGDTWMIDGEHKIADPQWRGFCFEDRQDYIDDYAALRAPLIDATKERRAAPTQSLWPDFDRYFESLLKLSPYFNDRIDQRVGFEVTGPGGGDWAVDFHHGGVVDQEIGRCDYVYTFDSLWLPELLAGDVPWEDFFLSCRFLARRDPDLYNDHLLGLLKFASPSALEAVEQYETVDRSSALMDIEVEGFVYQVQRFCPHAGVDLSTAGELLPGGAIRCLGHHFDFDVRTGQCLNGASKPLRIIPLGPTRGCADPPPYDSDSVSESDSESDSVSDSGSDSPSASASDSDSAPAAESG